MTRVNTPPQPGLSSCCFRFYLANIPGCATLNREAIDRRSLHCTETLMPAQRYKVTLMDNERQALLALRSKSITAAYELTRARILLQADQSPTGPAGADEHMAQALHGGRRTVERTRQAVVDVSLEAALSRQKRIRPKKLKEHYP